MADLMRKPGAPRERMLRGFGRGLLRMGPKSGNEPELPAGHPEPGVDPARRRVRGPVPRQVAPDPPRRRRVVATPTPSGSSATTGSPAGCRRTRARTRRPRTSAAATPARTGEGWDEVYTRQVEEWLGQEDLPEPFCLVVSLVNPHDVLGYPASYERGGYAAEEFRDLGVELPPSFDEDLRGKPSVHTLMQMGMTAYLGPLRDRQAQLDYVNFYAYLHRVIDEKIGRVLGALGDADDPESLRSRTVVVRISDHGEMGLSHGGLRQKAFNAYEETIRVPIVVSNPALFPEPAETDAFAGLIDVMPTLAALAGAYVERATSRARTSSPRRSPSTPRHASTSGCAMSHRRPPRSRTGSTSPTTTTRPARRCRT